MKRYYTGDVWNESENMQEIFTKYLIAVASLHIVQHAFSTIILQL